MPLEGDTETTFTVVRRTTKNPISMLNSMKKVEKKKSNAGQESLLNAENEKSNAGQTLLNAVVVKEHFITPELKSDKRLTGVGKRKRKKKRNRSKKRGDTNHHNSVGERGTKTNPILKKVTKNGETSARTGVYKSCFSVHNRKRMLKASLRKLQVIEDPEIFLLRSVLINNTMKRIQCDIQCEREGREISSRSQTSSTEETDKEKVHCSNNSIDACCTELEANQLLDSLMEDSGLGCDISEKDSGDGESETVRNTEPDKEIDDENVNQTNPDFITNSSNDAMNDLILFHERSNDEEEPPTSVESRLIPNVESNDEKESIPHQKFFNENKKKIDEILIKNLNSVKHQKSASNQDENDLHSKDDDDVSVIRLSTNNDTALISFENVTVNSTTTCEHNDSQNMTDSDNSSDSEFEVDDHEGESDISCGNKKSQVVSKSKSEESASKANNDRNNCYRNTHVVFSH